MALEFMLDDEAVQSVCSEGFPDVVIDSLKTYKEDIERSVGVAQACLQIIRKYTIGTGSSNSPWSLYFDCSRVKHVEYGKQNEALASLVLNINDLPFIVDLSMNGKQFRQEYRSVNLCVGKKHDADYKKIIGTLQYTE